LDGLSSVKTSKKKRLDDTSSSRTKSIRPKANSTRKKKEKMYEYNLMKKCFDALRLRNLKGKVKSRGRSKSKSKSPRKSKKVKRKP
jgi:hypothetical protein